VDEAALAPPGAVDDTLSAVCRKLLHAPAGPGGGDDRTLLLAELTPAKD
jgi:hypothetical protein